LQDDETELVQRAALRDVAAWSTLYERHYDDVYAYSFSRLGAREDAEDMASQVFVEALKGIERFSKQRPRPVLAWLLALARTLIATRRQQAARALRNQPFVQPAFDPGDAEALVERLDLLSAIKHLTQEQQDALILRFFLGKTTSEIAALMGRKENAIFALQFRAVRALRRHLSPDEAAQIFRTEGGGS